LAPRVVYPTANALIQSRDSNFIFGSVGNGNASLTINGAPVHVWPNGAFLAWLPIPTVDMQRYDLVVALGSDTARLTRPVRLLPSLIAAADSTRRDSLADTVRTADSTRLARADSSRAAVADTARRLTAPDTTPRYVVLGAPDSTMSDTDRVVIARPLPAGTYKWFFFPGTVLREVGRSGDFVRVRLDDALDVWVNAADAIPAPAGTTEPLRIAGNARVVPAAEWIDLAIPMGARPAYAVEERGTDVVLTLYGTRATTDIISYRGNDPAVRTVEWLQETNDRARFTVHLRDRPFGYLALWDSSRASFVLRLRRRPTINPHRPLAGLTIAVDPGHPPIGATGPTGLWEPQATLWVGERLAGMLRERGATVVMTRTTMDPVELGARPVIARRANAHLLVSVHLNAFGDGINPFRAYGTGTYFFRAQAEPVARAVQRRMVARMRLPDNGVFYDNLALARPTWMPSILCEGAFLMFPDQEAALRTPAFQDAYARGIADGIEEYFRALPADR
ncbi:MAG TPA: N-acetylmuramoyl-L-alanine amidase, partial [Gemmatimonadaceae bacterium]|nr:N-acetylmuramoyl-L-alanine amidase [Gemmatimonadaceae bacterium]